MPEKEYRIKNHKEKLLLGLSLLSLILASGCGVVDVFSEYGTDHSREEEKVVELTLTATAEGNPDAAVETPLPAATSPTKDAFTATANGETEMGAITGTFAYPSEILPALRIVAFEANNFNNYYYTEVNSGSAYSIETPPGVYFLLAYFIDPAPIRAEPGLVGTYSQDVSCSLHIDCSGQSLIPIQVKPGQIVEDIMIDVWVPPDEQKDTWPIDPIHPATSSTNGDLVHSSQYRQPTRVVALNAFLQDSYKMRDLRLSTFHAAA